MIEPAFCGSGQPGALKICVISDEDYYPWTPAAYFQEFHWELYFLNRLNSVSIVQELVKRDFDLFVNMCDSGWTEAYPGPEVIRVLEEAGVAFTGADSAFYDPSREEMKRVCRMYGLHTPASLQVTRLTEIEQAAASLTFPLIVKIPNSFGSTGILPDSRVETVEDLRIQAERVIQEFGGALVEEFIEGREFTVLVAENPDDPFSPKVYQPIEFLFPPGETFKHFQIKWFDWEKMRAQICADPLLAGRLMEVGRKLFIGLNGVSYGRCDMRVNAQGEIYILEINPNCGILYAPHEPGSADLVLMNDPEGHRGFIDLIFRAALARRDRLTPNWQVRYRPDSGYGLYARRTIAPGETILPLEKRPHTLVSLSHVRHAFPPLQLDIFNTHAYPLSDEVWVMPATQPSEWTPINHACDPNAWWQGLDITARRPIQAGEQITLDYATFHNQRMPEFACSCGAADCRRLIRGSDFLLPFVERYAGHVTDYVRVKRNAQSALAAETHATITL